MDDIDRFIQGNIHVHEEFYAPVRVQKGCLVIVKSKREFLEEERLLCGHCGVTLIRLGTQGSYITSDDYDAVRAWVVDHLKGEK